MHKCSSSNSPAAPHHLEEKGIQLLLASGVDGGHSKPALPTPTSSPTPTPTAALLSRGQLQRDRAADLSRHPVGPRQVGRCRQCVPTATSPGGVHLHQRRGDRRITSSPARGPREERRRGPCVQTSPPREKKPHRSGWTLDDRADHQFNTGEVDAAGGIT